MLQDGINLGKSHNAPAPSDGSAQPGGPGQIPLAMQTLVRGATRDKSQVTADGRLAASTSTIQSGHTERAER
jgi:hypothetical protein